MSSAVRVSSSSIHGVSERLWSDAYRQRLIVTDVVVVTWAVLGTQLVWRDAGFTSAVAFEWTVPVRIPYWAVSVLLVAAWMAALQLSGSRSARLVGEGSDEYRELVRATFALFAVIAMLGYSFQIDFARGYIFIALPSGLFFLLLSRWMWRQWLAVRRSVGKDTYRTLLVGGGESVRTIRTEFARVPTAGYRVIAQCITDFDVDPADPILTYTSVSQLSNIVRYSEIDTLVFTGGSGVTSKEIRALSWELEPGRQRLIFAPSLTDIGGPRLLTRPVAGLPLMHVDVPSFSPGTRFGKRVLDIALSSLALILLSPVLAVLSLLVALTSPGGVLFRQSRIGLNGEPFLMLKFRSMVDGADLMLQNHTVQADAGNEVLFKSRNDPRVTPLGRMMRRFSLDELPQLVNVLCGEMSLVGPRPPLAREVAVYEDHVHRRFLVKPGITGLWQVSGRSDLSWEESVRLDLYYVENWSFSTDLYILWRTLRAVIRSSGAY